MVLLDPVIDKIFEEALHLDASDIHLEPNSQGLQLRWRVNGTLLQGPCLPESLQEAVIARLKMMAGVDLTQGLVPQDGALGWRHIRGRFSSIPVLGGASIVIRLYKNLSQLEKLDGLGLDATQETVLKSALKRGQGLIIFAGPTGSGKTTSFYAALRSLDPAQNKIITVEDPVEQRLPGVCQVPVQGSLTFASALRSILRQAPNIIGVGELRDGTSVQMAVQAALTGHMVIATLHADSAAAVPVRLMDMGVEPSVLAEVLSCVVAQRLLFYRYSNTVFGAHGVFETFLCTPEVSKFIRQRASAAELSSFMLKEGFIDMRTRAQQLVYSGKLPQEALLGEFDI